MRSFTGTDNTVNEYENFQNLYHRLSAGDVNVNMLPTQRELCKSLSDRERARNEEQERKSESAKHTKETYKEKENGKARGND